MDNSIREILQGRGENYILPFLWMRGEAEEIIRRELAAIHESGIQAVCLEARPHPDFAGEQWWHDVDIVLDEAKKRNMKIWILDDAHFPTGMANGLIKSKYPERAKQYVYTRLYDIAGPKQHVTLNVAASMKKQISWMDIGKPVVKPLVDEQQLLSVMAYPLKAGDVVREQGIDLTGSVKDGILTYSFPAGLWRVFVNFTTYDEGGNPEYINIIDEESVQVLLEAVYEPHYQRYKDDFGTVFMGFFSDEPGMGNCIGFEMDDKIGRKMMPLPWNKDVPVLLEQRLGAEWRKLLPYLWADTENGLACRNVRLAYMDIVTRLYERNFCGQLGRWCQEHGVSYIGHVIEDNNEHCHLGCGAGHYFRAMKGQHMAGIDNIGGQVVPGMGDTNHRIVTMCKGPFYHYVEAKMGASAALFDENKQGRLMCETYGAYGWGLGVRDMKWITDHLVAQGVNYLVPHAFSMAEYPDLDCPPHFNARGNNPQLPYFGTLMRYANRLCHVFNGGRWMPDTAILYYGEQEWLSDCMCMEEPAAELCRNQIDYCILPLDALTDTEEYHTVVNGDTVTVNGTALSTIIVTESEYADSRLVDFMKAYPQVKILFVNDRPKAVAGTDTDQTEKLQILQQGEIVPLGQLAAKLRTAGIGAVQAGRQFSDLLVYHYRRDDDIYMLVNESMSETYEGTVTLKTDRPLMRYDAMKNCLLPLACQQIMEAGTVTVSLTLAPYESAVFTGCADAQIMAEKDDLEIELAADLSKDWKVSMAKAQEYPDFGDAQKMKILVPISAQYPTFSGIIRYEKELDLEQAADKAILQVEHLYEVGRVLVDGEEADRRICPPYEFDLSGRLHEGKNHIVVETVNTPARDVLGLPPGPFGHERGFYEPSGMFGTVKLVLSE